MNRLIGISCGLLVAAGCATTSASQPAPPEQPAAAAQAAPEDHPISYNPLEQSPAEAANKLSFARKHAPDDFYICEKEKPTGSHFAEVKCKTVRQYDEERERTQHVVDQVTVLKARPRGFGGE